MDPLEELLRAARHAPQAGPERLSEVTRRGRRRKTNRQMGVAAGVVAVVGMSALTVGALGGDSPGVVASVTSREPSAQVVVGDPISWRAAHVGADERTITITFSAGDPNPASRCHHAVRSRVVESAESVSVTIESVTSQDRTPVRCLARLYPRTETITLGSPLGGRRLLDGADGAERSVSR